MIQERNMWMQVLLVVVTLGIYMIYWYYVTSKEMLDHNRADGSAGLRTLLLFVPYLSFIATWKHSRLVEELTNRRYNVWLIFILWIVFSPAMWFITQTELNKLARENAVGTQAVPA